MPDEIRSAMKMYDWPGNVDELKRSITRLMWTDNSKWMDVLPPTCQHHCSNRIKHRDTSYVDAQELRQFLASNQYFALKKAKNCYLARVEKKIMKAVLANINGNRKKAAGLLGISYKTMLNRTKQYKVSEIKVRSNVGFNK